MTDTQLFIQRIDDNLSDLFENLVALHKEQGVSEEMLGREMTPEEDRRFMIGIAVREMREMRRNMLTHLDAIRDLAQEGEGK